MLNLSQFIGKTVEITINDTFDLTSSKKHVISSMCSATLKKIQVLWSVIFLHLIDVVDRFTCSQITANVFFNYYPMFKNMKSVSFCGSRMIRSPDGNIFRFCRYPILPTGMIGALLKGISASMATKFSSSIRSMRNAFINFIFLAVKAFSRLPRSSCCVRAFPRAVFLGHKDRSGWPTDESLAALLTDNLNMHGFNLLYI